MDPFKYREIVGTFTARLPDGGDSDQLPDRVMLNGYGTLRPNIRGTSVVFTEVGEFAVPRTRQVAFVDGELMVEVVDGESSILQPLFLEVTVDERANQQWSWTLTFDSLTIGEWGEEISHPALSFPVEDGEGPLELSTVATTATRTSSFVTRGEPGVVVSTTQPTGGQVWVDPTGGGTPTATSSRDGLMSASDKEKVDAVPDPSTITTDSDLADAISGIPAPSTDLATPSRDGLMSSDDKHKLDGVSVDFTAGTSVRVRVNGIIRNVYYETGFRSLADELVNGTLPNDSGLQVSRTNDLVELRLIRWAPGQAGEVPLIASLPSGFRPNNSTTLFVSEDGTPTDLNISFSNGAISVLVLDESAEISGVVHYRVDSGLPSSLPGKSL